MNVRRLAAVDLHGASGTARRRRVVLTEFIAGLAGATALGVWLAVSAGGAGTRVLGIWLAGVGLNYAVLAAYAIALSRPGALAAELAGTDPGREARRYGLVQLWILVPFSLVVLAATGLSAREAGGR